MSDDNGFEYETGRGWELLHGTQESDSDSDSITEALEYSPENTPYHLGTPYSPAEAWKMSRPFRVDKYHYDFNTVFKFTIQLCEYHALEKRILCCVPVHVP